MRRMPENPMNEQATAPEQPDDGFEKFVGNAGFLRHVHKNGHIPMWVHPKIAHQLLMQHGQGGAVVPHPNIDLDDITK